MATPEPLEHSPRLIRAAKAERGRLERELRRETALITRLRDSLSDAEDRAAQLQQRLDLLAAIAVSGEEASEPPRGDNIVPFPEAEAEPPNGYLKGQAIRRVAVQLLFVERGGGHPIHYSDWFSLLRDAGYGIAARDPRATFLTQVSRSPVVSKGSTPGTYMLDLDATRHLRRQNQDLNAELLALHHGQQTIAEIADVRQRRTELVAAIARVERALEEAIESLGDASADDAGEETGESG